MVTKFIQGKILYSDKIYMNIIYTGTLFILCTGAFLYAPYRSLLISNKFCDSSLLHCPVVGRGGSSYFIALVH